MRAAVRGAVTTTDAADADFARSRLLMHVRDCSTEEIRVLRRENRHLRLEFDLTRPVAGQVQSTFIPFKR